MMTRAEVLRKCITVFEAIRRMASKGNAGLEPERGAEEEYSTVEECVRVMKEWLREMEAGAHGIRGIALTKEQYEEMERRFRTEIEAPQHYTMEGILQGNPLMAQETIEAARRVDEARDRIIDQIGRMEPDVPKVVDLKEWQRLKTPPERLDFDEEPLE